MTPTETINRVIRGFEQEIVDLRHELHIRQGQCVDKDKRISELERKLWDVRRYLVPMQTWDLDEHARGHVAMMIHLTGE
jgi:Mg2+ and Co2+ transporter CorA